jgi:hypothetical protein
LPACPKQTRLLLIRDYELGDLLALWRDRLKAEHKSANTIRAYLAALGALRAWCESTGTPFELDKPTVAAFTGWLLDSGREAATARPAHVSGDIQAAEYNTACAALE